MEALLALGERFGPRLTLERVGNNAFFGFDGQTVVLECDPSGVVRATFDDRPARDPGMDRSWIARYSRPGATYSLGESGCERLARDVAEFFGGVREPRFAFSSLV